MYDYKSQNQDIYGADWINAQKFGFVGDGETPNDEVFARYIAECPETTLYFGPGIYCFEKTVNFPREMFVEMDAKAELKCIAKEPLEYFVTLRFGDESWGPFEAYALRSYIKGGIINANFCAKVALGVHGALHTHFRDFMIRDVLEKGIVTQTSKLHDGCAYFDNIYFYNSKPIKGTIAIFDNTADNAFNMCTAVNFETGIRTSGGKFTNCSCWFNALGKSLIPTSVYARMEGGSQAVFINPMIDTYRTGFELRRSASGSYPRVAISNLVWITNDVFYTRGQWSADDNLQRDYPMQIFNAESDECRVELTGMNIPWREWGFSFSNIPMPSSTFMNVRFEQGWDPWNDMKNFRDDTYLIKKLLGNLYDFGDRQP